MRFRKLVTAVLVLVSAVSLQSQQWEPKKAALMTKYATDVTPGNVLPEYPRPQLVRKKWMNLNGLWQFQPATSAGETLPKGALARTILIAERCRTNNAPACK